MERVCSIITFVLLVLYGCAKQEDGTLLDDIKKRGVLRVGVSVFVPRVMNDRKGNLVGFEIDVATALARDLGVKVEFVNTGRAGIIPALIAGKFDLIIGGMTINDMRLQQVDFTDPYNFTGMSILANKSMTPGYKSLEEFNRRNIIIGVRNGSSAVDATLKNIPYAQLRLYDDEIDAVRDLLTGRIHAVVAKSPFPEFQTRKFKGKLYLPLDESFSSESIGMVLRKGEGQIKRFLNEWIKKRWSDGFLCDRKNYWFKSSGWEKRVY